MQILTDTASIMAMAATHPDPELRRLLGLRIESLAEFGDIAELMNVLVLDPDDTVAELVRSCSLPKSLRSEGIHPEMIETHSHWFEATFITSQDGAGFVVYVPTSHPELLALLG